MQKGPFSLVNLTKKNFDLHCRGGGGRPLPPPLNPPLILFFFLNPEKIASVESVNQVIKKMHTDKDNLISIQ